MDERNRFLDHEENRYREFIDTKGIAAYLGVSRRTVMLWKQKHNMPCRKVGAVVRYSVPEIRAWYARFSVGETGSEQAMVGISDNEERE